MAQNKKDLDISSMSSWVCHHDSKTKCIWLEDHFGSFDAYFKNTILDQIPDGYTVYTEYFFPAEVHQSYQNLDLKFSGWLWLHGNHIIDIAAAAAKMATPPLHFENFLSAFFRANTPERHVILTKLYQNGWFDDRFFSKHFEIDSGFLQGWNIDYSQLDQDFVHCLVTHNFQSSIDHRHNLDCLSPIIQKTFLHLVIESKSLGTTVSFPTEKFLHAVANRRLWLAVAPPNYHKTVSQQLGFELYDCFDYEFDSIWNDQHRMDAIITQLKKFSQLSQLEWRSVYHQQQKALNQNYERLASMKIFDHVVNKDQKSQFTAVGQYRLPTQDRLHWQQYMQQKKIAFADWYKYS